jgi:dTDP-4-dehydrorhamnose 3,5-epimerase-like enzyme
VPEASPVPLLLNVALFGVAKAVHANAEPVQPKKVLLVVGAVTNDVVPEAVL